MARNTYMGSRCARGHGGERFVSSRNCVECSYERSAALRKADPEAARVRSNEYYRANREMLVAKRREYYTANKSKILDGVRKRRVANAEHIRERERRYRKAHPEHAVKALVRTRKWKGLPDPTRPCPGSCECCGNKEVDRRLSLDHCHISGAFRGWLCDRCNRCIGQMGDSIEGLMNAVRYLQRAAKQQEISNG